MVFSSLKQNYFPEEKSYAQLFIEMNINVRFLINIIQYSNTSKYTPYNSHLGCLQILSG